MILHHGLKRMVERQENVYYYITLLNENYPMPGLKPGTEEQIIKGMYLLRRRARKKTPRVNLLGSGTILRESQAARELLAQDWGVAANVWSCPSFNELTRDGQDCERWNLLHPTEKPRVPFVTQQLDKHAGPVIASTDYMKNYAEQIRAFIPKGRSYKVLGTDGFGRSDFRSQAARALRGQPPLHRGRGAEGAGRRRRACRWPRWPRRSRSTASTPNASIRCTPDTTDRTDDRRRTWPWWKSRYRTSATSRMSRSSSCWSSAGDTVKVEQSLITVESDKASMEIPSSHAGVVKELKIKLGDKVGEGSLLLMLEAEGAAPAPRLPARRRRRPPPRPPRLHPRPPPAAPAAAGGPVDIVVPDIGDFDEVAVIELLASRAMPSSSNRA